MKVTIMLAVLVLGVQTVMAADPGVSQQPRQNVAQEAFLQSECNVKEANTLREQGFQAQVTSTNLIAAQWQDEGVEGYYLASTYFQKGMKPWERESATVIALVTISHGRVGSVTCLDSVSAAQALLNSGKPVQ